MKKAILFFLVLLPFRVFAQGDLLQSLDSVLNRRRYYIDIKENRIRRLTQEVKGVTTGIVLPLQESSFGNITPTVSIPPCIYNYRTAVRKRAIHPETFEDDVKKLK